MTTSLVRALALTASLLAAPAFAQSAAAASATDLPSEAKVVPFRPVPGVGSVPGSIIQMVDRAEDCAKDARKVADGLMAPGDAVAVCNEAISTGISDNQRLAGTFVNRGVLLVQEGRAAEAIADLDKGIALGPEEPERAFYNRGLAREDLKDIKGAYADYKMASEIRPGWEPVQNELTRFRVVNK